MDGLLAADDEALEENLALLAADLPLLRQLHAHTRAVAPAADFADVLAASRREYARAASLVGRAPVA